MAKIVLINPRFEPSFWGLEYALPLMHRRCAMPTAALPLIAALTPREHDVIIVDENVESIVYGRLAGADIVALTGMSVQRHRMMEILTELKRRGHFTVVGGPWVTVKEDYFGTLADTIFVGEAEETWPTFLADWTRGSPLPRYEQTARTDMTRLPAPRYDLLRMRHYLFGSIQLSRGCPYRCEFCDIIVTFGRRPRFKTIPQIIAELDELLRCRMEIVFIVDDNLVGNKPEIKTVLKEIAAWQEGHGFPIIFVAEASLDLAEDEELIGKMLEANILSVFIGVESPNEESLRETKKFQNLRGGTVLDRVHRVQNAFLEVWCGMIVGFDSDDRSIFDLQRRFIESSRITEVMTGMLFAIPKTPLYDRLAKEQRLDLSDRPAFGTNVIPLKLTREELRDGYIQLMNEAYEPENYFSRLESYMGRADFRFAPPFARYLEEHPFVRARVHVKQLLGAGFLMLQLMFHVPQPELRRRYRDGIIRLIKRRREPHLLFAYVLRCVMHYHQHTLARSLREQRETGTLVNSYQ